MSKGLKAAACRGGFNALHPLPFAATFLSLALAAPWARSEALRCPLVEREVAHSAAWAAPIAEARARLARLDATSDCREVTLSTDGASGTLGFETRDGRRATRRLDAPAELLPTLEALLVTLGAPSRQSTPPEESPEPLAEHTQSAAPRSDRASDGVALAFTAGPRIAAIPRAYLAPSLALDVSVLRGAWTYALALEAAPVHTALAAAPQGFAFATYAAGLAFGRREELGKLTVGYGVRAAVHALDLEAAPAADSPNARSLSAWQPRVGAEGYGLVPLNQALALRFGLVVDTPIARFSMPATTARDLPTLPRLGSSATVGFEARIL